MKTIRIYHYDKCSTCKEAIKFLVNNRFAIEPVDIFTKPPSKTELKKMLDYQKGNIKRLVNATGHLYQEMGLKEKIKTMTEEEVLDLLSKNGRLIKRPMVFLENTGLVGFDKAEWKKVLLG